MPRGKKVIIHWTDTRYLEEFYKAWGSGQSTTVREPVQDVQTEEAKTDTPDTPRKAAENQSGEA